MRLSATLPQFHFLGYRLNYVTYPQSFPPFKRLRVSHEFSYVFSNAEHRFRENPLQVLATPQLNDVSRLGLVIPKKMLKKAVDRNRLKRLLREHFRKWQCEHRCDVVIMLKQKIDPTLLYSTQMNNTIQDLFSRLDRYLTRKAQAKAN